MSIYLLLVVTLLSCGFFLQVLYQRYMICKYVNIFISLYELFLCCCCCWLSFIYFILFWDEILLCCPGLELLTSNDPFTLPQLSRTMILDMYHRTKAFISFCLHPFPPPFPPPLVMWMGISKNLEIWAIKWSIGNHNIFVRIQTYTIIMGNYLEVCSRSGNCRER